MLFDIVTGDVEGRAMNTPIKIIREIDVSQLTFDSPVCVVHYIRHLVEGGFPVSRELTIYTRGEKSINSQTFLFLSLYVISKKWPGPHRLGDRNQETRNKGTEAHAAG